MAKPDPTLKGLDVFLGKWHMEGQARASAHARDPAASWEVHPPPQGLDLYS
jgi:hypothetical protein